MPTAEDDGQAIDYILENRGAYPRPQIDAELLNRGYGRAAIEAFWSGIEEGYADAAQEKTAEGELRSLTAGWTKPVLILTYVPEDDGEAAFERDAAILSRHGYRPSLQSSEGGHVHAGRLLLTAGWSVLAGKRGIRSEGKLTVTFERVAEPAPSGGSEASGDPVDQIRRLAELRDAGIVTSEEFEAKKAELLGRM